MTVAAHKSHHAAKTHHGASSHTKAKHPAHPPTGNDVGLLHKAHKAHKAKAHAAQQDLATPKAPPSAPTADAGTGVDTLGATGTIAGGSDLSSVLKTLTDALSQLSTILQGMVSGGGGDAGGCDAAQSGVLAEQGTAASNGEYVAPVATAVVANSGSENSGFERRVTDLINAERAKYGLSQVTYNAQLDQAATKHNGQMERTGSMAHEGIGDGSPGERIRAEGFSKAWGENVATGQTSPEQVVREWMASPEHRRNILDPNFHQMGVSYGTAASGRTYWAQEFGA